MVAGDQLRNQLVHESSVYLQQHAADPVAWQPWSAEAFDYARRNNLPVFVSIGYSTCHWCHVMAHESFQNPTIAEYLNQHFVSIKVDREERPDVDAFCMDVCQATTGHGGWPLTIMMDADQRPFFAGTYFPPKSTQNRMGFWELIQRVHTTWVEDRPRISNIATQILQAMTDAASSGRPGPVPSTIIPTVIDWHSQRYDASHGGFGQAPKFPSAHRLLLLLRYAARTQNANATNMVVNTLRAMRAGGLYDHVGFGFHRYSTDARWLVPHFEKMLSDQAMLMMAYTEAWQCTHDGVFKTTVFELAEYVHRELTLLNGAFCSAQDADSDGKEGAFYLFTLDEFQRIANDVDDADGLATLLGVSATGNFVPPEGESGSEAVNILHCKPQDLDELIVSKAWDTVRRGLLAYRSTRVPPLTDGKLLPDWNGLMIAALAKAARVFGSADLLDMAVRAEQVVEPRTHLLDDHAMLAWGCVELYQTTGNDQYLDRACRLVERIHASFYHDGKVYLTSIDAETVPVRQRMPYDGAYPSGNSVAALVLAQLGHLLHNDVYIQRATEYIEQYADLLQQPSDFCGLLLGWEYLANDALTLTLGQAAHTSTIELHSIQQVIHHVYVPWLLVQHDSSLTALAMFCNQTSCEAPLNHVDDVVVRLTKEVTA
ncbi:MAG: thioredoxin domain-containing protein [Bradyrhizobiaceae bacterium]|nr:thioredoxin domain-containing protein [Bradyrhizobiaceae bacterium]